MKKTKFFTCIAMLGLILSLGACTPNDDTSPSSDTGSTTDTDTSGSEEHTHSYELTDSKDATCTEAGYKTYTCSCGDTYTETIDALGHDYQPSVTPPTCTEKGYTTYTCSRCGDSYTAEETDPTGHTPTGDYLSDETGHWKVCADCGAVVDFEAHTPSTGYESDGNTHWQVCSVCGYKMNEQAHTEGSLGYIDQNYHGTKCTVCGKVLTQEAHNFDAVWDDVFEEWTRVCTDCGIELGSITYDSKYAIVGDFGEDSWTLAPSDKNLILEYDSRYQNTQHWIRTVTTTEYNRQGYDAGFRICKYDAADKTWTTIADYRNLDTTASTGVIGSSGAYDYNILLDWSTTYTIEVDCSGATPKIVVNYVEGGYEEEEVDGYAIVGTFDDSSWNTYPDLDSVYYLEPNDANHWERTITAGGDASFSGFRVTEYGSYNTVADKNNLTNDSTGVTGQTAADYNILTTPGLTYDVVLDVGTPTTIKVTIHEEEVQLEPVTDETTLKAALEVGGEITLENDISISASLYLYEDAVIDMNGHKIEPSKDIFIDDSTTKDWSILSIDGDIDVTIKGNGTFASRANDTYAIDVRGGARVTIEDGTYVGNIDCIYIEEGFVSIYGGHFSIIQLYNGSYKWLLNCLDNSVKAGNACFYLYGGEYENFDPSVATGPTVDGTTLYEAVVMEGYTVVSSELSGGGTLYSVVEAPVEETHTFATDLSSLPNSTFGEEGEGNPKNGTWTRGIFYYWADNSWIAPWYAWVTVNNASYVENLGGYNFAWTTSTAYGSAEPYAFQIFYTLPEEAGLTIGTTYSITMSFVTDYSSFIEINGNAVYATEGENTVTISGLTASNLSDLSIQVGDNLYAGEGDGNGYFPLTGNFTITSLAFDYAKADIEEGETEYHSYVVDFGSTDLYEDTDAVGTIGSHLGAFVYNYNLVSGNVNLTSDGLTLTYDKEGSPEPPWSGVTLCYNLPADSGLSEGAGANYKYTIRLTAEYDCTLRINEEEFTLTGGEEFELNTHQSNYGGAASNAPTILMYFASISDSTLVCPNTITISYLAFDF